MKDRCSFLLAAAIWFQPNVGWGQTTEDAKATTKSDEYPTQQPYPEQSAYPPAQGNRPPAPSQPSPSQRSGPPPAQPGYQQQQPSYQGQPGYQQPGQAGPEYPPGTYPPGTYPPGTYPPGTYPPGTYPPGTYPPGAYAAPPPPYSMGPVPGSNPELLRFSTPELEEKLDGTSLGAPIVFLSIGVPSILIGGVWFIGSIVGRSRCDDGTAEVNGLTYYDTACRQQWTPALLLSGAILTEGIAFTVVGSILLPKRISRRRELSREIQLRTNYGRTALFEVEPSLIPTPGGLSYGLVGTF